MDYIIARAQQQKSTLAIALIDMEKAFDTVPRARLMEVLQQQYHIDPNMVEVIRRMYIDTQGQVAGGTARFTTTMGVRQGCPMSPLLFSLFFDRVIYYIQQHTQATDAISVVFLVLQAALYADDVILLAPKPTSLQVQMDLLAAFSATEAMRVSHDKTKILLLNC